MLRLIQCPHELLDQLVDLGMGDDQGRRGVEEAIVIGELFHLPGCGGDELLPPIADIDPCISLGSLSALM